MIVKNGNTILTILLIALALPLFGGCATTGRSFGFGGPTAPVVLSSASTADHIVAAVNQNSSRIQTYQASRASFSLPGMPGLPLLSGSIAIERPSNFRLRAETRLSGPEVDLGSNVERFWFWARRNEPAGVFTARHSDFANSQAATQVPIDPTWVVEALGLVALDPAASYQGPFPRSDRSVELRTQVATTQGTSTRVYVVDSATAQVKEQLLYDAAGTLLGSVTADNFRFDPTHQVTYPQKVTLRVPAAEMALTINTGEVLINAPISGGNLLWQMPQISGTPVVDITQPQQLPLVGQANPWDLGGASSSSPWRSNQPLHTNFVSQQQAEQGTGRIPSSGVTIQ